MLKKASNFVLASKKSSTYPKAGTPPVFFSSAAALGGFVEHPENPSPT
jgi:hypothetical protein